ncbi:MAG: type II toxin-antitoxin system PemK/MazF family toxin [Methylocystis sp.]|nr:type II toxin-antitoxin system PemK/MazF family toxin [Methylocystis sp.]MBI3275066.1 type II toxin-antitoxin system PemK/MazF family toxin [Methylocystis sp.]
MSATALDAGDLVWVDFDPAFGHEQSGRRPAVIISAHAYNRRSSFVLACPVTSSAKHWPFHVALSAGGKVEGAVIVDQIKAIDRRRIVSKPVDRVADVVLEQVRGVLTCIIGSDLRGG